MSKKISLTSELVDAQFLRKVLYCEWVGIGLFGWEVVLYLIKKEIEEAVAEAKTNNKKINTYENKKYLEQRS